MNVSIIIVNYNTKQLLANCLNSIKQKTLDIDYEVIVVDNDSHDGSVELLKDQYPWVTIIESGGNLGFGRANNLGIAVAGGKYVFLLNPDTILLNNATMIFFKYMEENNKYGTIGCIGCMLLDADYKPNLSFGLFPSIKNEVKYLYDKVVDRLNKKKSNTQGEAANVTSFEVDYVSGADLFIPRNVLATIGNFDKKFFMFYEETDLQKRMSSANLRRLIINGPQIIHLEGKSFTGSSAFSYSKFLLSQKSLNYYIDKHFKGLNYFKMRIGIIFIRSTVLFDSRFKMKEKIKAFTAVLCFTQ